MTAKQTIIAGIMAVCTILAALLAVPIIQTTPVQADTGTVSYGAGAYDGSNPIGGGNSYVSAHGYSQDTADYVVTTTTDLRNALAAAQSGQVVWIPGSAVINISGLSGSLTVPAGVALASDRGKDGSPGGLINFGGRTGVIIWRQSNSVVSGLRFYGTNSSGGAWVLQSRAALHTEVENCEVANGGAGGIGFKDDNVPWNSDWVTGIDQKHHWVHNCYIHGFSQSGLGYGVSVLNSGVLIECCIIGDCRHLIMGQRTSSSSQGYDTNYEARYNQFQNSSSNTQVDCHGGNDTTAGGWGPSPVAVPGDHAGGTLKIHHNTFSNNNGRLNIGIRGIPGATCDVYNNWTQQTTHSGLYTETNPGNGTFKQYLVNLVAKSFNGSIVTGNSFINMSVHDNWYGTTAPSGGTNAGSGDDASGGTSSNHAPVLSAIGDKSAAVATTISFTLSATDADHDTLTYSASSLPSGATFNTSTGAFSWTPQSSETYTLSFSVSDGSLSDSKDTTITVIPLATSASTAPTLVSPADGTTVSGTSVTFTWDAYSGATKYFLIVSTNPDLNAAQANAGVRKVWRQLGNVTQYTVTGFANKGTTYYWWVYAGTSSGWSTESDVVANGGWHFVST